MRALCPLKVKLTARGEQAGGRERSAEWRCQQLEAVAARAGLAVPDAGEQGSDTPGDSSAVGSEVDSPVKEETANIVTRAIDKYWIAWAGPPEMIRADMAGAHMSQEFTDWAATVA